MSDGPDAPAPPAAKPSLKQRLSAQFNEYGTVAIVTYFTLSILAIIGFSIAIWIGAEPSSATGVIGVILAGWVAAKATLPLRILITLGLTPIVAYVVTRRRRSKALAEDLPEVPIEDPPDAPIDAPPGAPSARPEAQVDEAAVPHGDRPSS